MKRLYLYVILLILAICPYIPLPFLPAWGIYWIQISYLSLAKICLILFLFFSLIYKRKKLLLFCLPLLMLSAIFPSQLRHCTHFLIVGWNDGKSIKQTQNICPGTRMYINRDYTTFNWNLGRWDAYEELVYHPRHGQRSKIDKIEVIEVLNENWYIRKANLDTLE